MLIQVIQVVLVDSDPIVNSL